MGRGSEEGERSEQVTLMERRSPNTRGLQERGNKAPEQRERMGMSVIQMPPSGRRLVSNKLDRRRKEIST